MKKLIINVLLMLTLLNVGAFAVEKMHKVVIQVSTDNVRTQNIALNNAVNLQNLYGVDNVKIEIVAYGPGLSLLTKGSNASTRVSSLAMQDIKFSACMNTMAHIKKKTGKNPILTDGVGMTRSGAARIVELQEQGYAYLRP